MPDLKRAVLIGTAALVLAASPLAAQDQQKPNILVIQCPCGTGRRGSVSAAGTLQHRSLRKGSRLSWLPYDHRATPQVGRFAYLPPMK